MFNFLNDEHHFAVAVYEQRSEQTMLNERNAAVEIEMEAVSSLAAGLQGDLITPADAPRFVVALVLEDVNDIAAAEAIGRAVLARARD